jgi:uncharacterized damage-inducible protein DinB
VTFEDLNTLLDYHYWARDRVLDAVEPLTAEQLLRPVGGSFTSIRDTLVHIYSADWVWCSRWGGESPTSMLDPTPFADVPAIRSAWQDLERRTRAFVNVVGPAGIGCSVAYKMMDGRPSEQVFWHLVQHMVNHGTYHRGQVTTLLRQVGAAPPRSMDLVTFYRERQADGRS